MFDNNESVERFKKRHLIKSDKVFAAGLFTIGIAYFTYWVIGLFVSFAAIAGIAYIVLHFVTKFW